jgi:hypothetical protein
MVQNPRHSGVETGGPARSVQLIVKVSPTAPPADIYATLSVESAPHLPSTNENDSRSNPQTFFMDDLVMAFPYACACAGELKSKSNLAGLT